MGTNAEHTYFMLVLLTLDNIAITTRISSLVCWALIEKDLGVYWICQKDGTVRPERVGVVDTRNNRMDVLVVLGRMIICCPTDESPVVSAALERYC
jgi:hypothetical protein